MTLDDNISNQTHHFPTHAAYLVPVEIKEIPQYGEGQKGVFAIERIPKGTKLWVWTDRITSIHHKKLRAHIERNFGDNQKEIQVFLRQGFVLPPSSSSETMTPPAQTEDNTQGNNATTADASDNDNNNSNVDNFFHSNPTDSGRLTNHSSDPNTGPDGTLRDILQGEELTMDYSFHGNPEWYQTICAKYEVLTETQIARSAAAAAAGRLPID